MFQDVCVPCHATGKGGLTNGKLDLSSSTAAFGALVNVKSTGTSCSKVTPVPTRVIPGSSMQSLLWQKLNAKTTAGAKTPCGDPMPENTTALSASDLQMVANWIDQGANP